MIPATPPAIVARGHVLYTQHCSSCHGTDLRGGDSGADIRGVGAADVDFMVGTGRMPAASAWQQPAHDRPRFSQTEIDEIVAYVTSVAPGGPAIPRVGNSGDLQRGAALFDENCQHCHGAEAQGNAIGGAAWAPTLANATVNQVAEAIRVGPGEMPRFSEQQLPQSDLNAVVAYVVSLRRPQSDGGVPIDTSGPMPEGFIGWVAIGACALLGAILARPRA